MDRLPEVYPTMTQAEFQARLVLALESIAHDLNLITVTDGAGALMVATREAI